MQPPASSYQFSSRSKQIFGGPPMQAICCRLFQSANSSSASIFCTYSMADSSPASSLTIPCQKRQQNLQHPLRSASFTFTDKKEVAQGCISSAALSSGHAGTPNSYPRKRAPLRPRGIWRASCTTYPPHLVQRREHLFQLLHFLPGHRLIVSIQILHVCAER